MEPAMGLAGLIKETMDKLQEQGQLISLLQAEVDFQNDRISKQEKLIEDLSSKVEELSEKLTHSQKIKNESVENDDEKSNDIWQETKQLSLADVVKETAEQTLMTNSGFIYDTQSKLYCNYTTGYYYDPAQELYYNGHTGTYYTYDADKQEYRFHSQVELPSKDLAGVDNKTERSKNQQSSKSHNYKKAVLTKQNRKQVMIAPKERNQITADVKKLTKTRKQVEKLSVNKTDEDLDDVEEGELSTSSSSNEHDSDSDTLEEDEIASDCGQENLTEMENANVEKFPPCIRAIIHESSLEEIKKGSLFLITCMGGTIGREGFEHAIMLPDPQIDKIHAQIQYMADPSDSDTDNKTEKYFIRDLGTRNGTFLNGKKLSEQKQQSDAYEILHGSTVKVGGFSILMHIHPGTFTCGHCEPGLLMETEFAGSRDLLIKDKSKSRNALMRQIKKKYGIERQLITADLPDAENYTDRSHKRRTVKGSDNPYEKTQVTTSDDSIGQSNKGFKMLAKMGWSAGNALGQSGKQGLLEPIKVELKSDRGGLGLEQASSLSSFSTTTSNVLGNASSGSKKSKHSNSKSKPPTRAEQLAITMKRFKEAEEIKMELDDLPS